MNFNDEAVLRIRRIARDVAGASPDLIPEPVDVGRHWIILSAPFRRAAHHQHFDWLALTVGDPASVTERDCDILAQIPRRGLVHVVPTLAEAIGVIRWWWVAPPRKGETLA